MRELIVVALFAVGCSSAEEPCEPIDTSCTPQYEATFENIHARTLTPSCANSASCHASETSSGGFSLADPDDGFGALAQFSEGGSCGALAVRITSASAAFQMPPGRPLSEGEQCAILLWIEAGSPR